MLSFIIKDNYTYTTSLHRIEIFESLNIEISCNYIITPCNPLDVMRKDIYNYDDTKNKQSSLLKFKVCNLESHKTISDNDKTFLRKN